MSICLWVSDSNSHGITHTSYRCIHVGLLESLKQTCLLFGVLPDGRVSPACLHHLFFCKTRMVRSMVILCETKYTGTKDCLKSIPQKNCLVHSERWAVPSELRGSNIGGLRCTARTCAMQLRLPSLHVYLQCKTCSNRFVERPPSFPFPNDLKGASRLRSVE